MSEIVKVLLIEDDEDDYLLTKDYLEHLESQSFLLTWVTNAKMALEKVSTSEFHLCLCDYKLAGETALDVLRLFDQHSIDLPVVVLSGQTDIAIDEKVMLAGATDYIAKQDIETPKFLRTLRYALARKEVENERIERKNIELQNKAKDRFLAHLGHELRTPLSSILGYTDLLLTNEKAKDSIEELTIIQNNGKHLLSLLNDLLDMSKIIANKFELTPRKVPLNIFLTDLYALMQISAYDKGLELAFESRSQIPEEIKVDATRLRQILINLLNNAVKFTEKGSVKMTVWFEPSIKSDGQPLLSFLIQDTGVGISTDKIKAIFKPFEQIEDVMRADRGGAGLGLSICHEIATRMGGEINVTSRLNEGSCFTLSIPILPAETEQLVDFSLTTHAEVANYSLSTFVSGRVLVVDDLAELRRLTGHLIKQAGANVDFAENGEAAIHSIKTAQQRGYPYDLVFMDIHMPVMNGSDAVQALRKDGYHLPVVALTAANHKGLVDELMAFGFDGVMPKPLDKLLLKNVLEKFLLLQKPHVESEGSSITTEANDSLHVHVIEDDEDAVQLMSILLGSLGANVTVSLTGKMALENVNRHKKFDLYLLDLTLPDVQGAELGATIRSLDPSARMVFISGSEPEGEVMERLGIETALLKPVSKDDLAQLLEL